MYAIDSRVDAMSNHKLIIILIMIHQNLLLSLLWATLLI